MNRTRTKPAAVPGLEDFFTREKANEGIKLELCTPDGKKTPHWLLIRGIDCDAYAQAHAEWTRKGSRLVNEDDAKRAEFYNEMKVGLRAVLVADWSFSDPALMGDNVRPFSFENVCKLLKEAPQIAFQVDQFSSSRTLFFRKPPNN